jgi:hypothetical protein
MRLCGSATIEEFPEAVFLTQSDARQTVMQQWNMSHTSTKQLRGEMFSVPSIPRLYNEGQLPLVMGCEPFRGVGMEMAVRRDGHQPART